MRRRLAVVAGMATATLSFSLLFAPSAAANGDEQNLMSMQACKSKSSSKFKFHIHYNSGQGGTYRNVGYSVFDFNSLGPGGSDPKRYPLRFCVINGASAPWPGSGLKIKNNAASGDNDHYKYTARVYFNSGYKGAQDAMAPYQHIDRFRNVYNENASFRWTS